MKIVEFKTEDEQCNGYVNYEVKVADVKDTDEAQAKLAEMVQTRFTEYDIKVPLEQDGAEHSIDSEDAEAEEGNLYRVDPLDAPSATEPVAVLQIEERCTEFNWFLVE